jgi:hypothetical protein
MICNNCGQDMPPADDGEPVTPGKLAAMGWDDDGFSNQWFRHPSGAGVIVAFKGGVPTVRLSGFGVVGVEATVGNVRRLLAALGVELKGAGS